MQTQEEKSSHKQDAPFIDLNPIQDLALPWFQERGYTADLLMLADTEAQEDGSIRYFFSDSCYAYEWMQNIEDDQDAFCSCMNHDLGSKLWDLWKQCSDYYV